MDLAFHKLTAKHLWRITKNSKYDFQETYELLRQRPNHASAQPHVIDNVFILKSFTVEIWFGQLETNGQRRRSDEFERKIVTLPHPRESELASSLHVPIRQVRYSENGERFMDEASDRQSLVYTNLRSGDFNIVHVYS